jgi:hypothetical protein
MSESLLSLTGLRDLFFKPSRYFRRGALLDRRVETLIATWIAGIDYAIQRVDFQLVKAELGRQSSLYTELSGSWIRFWAWVILVGVPVGFLVWFVAGWWYRVRLDWSGALAYDRAHVRRVYVHQNLVEALPTLVLTLACTVAFRNYREAWEASSALWDLAIALFGIWSCVTSYIAVTTAFEVSLKRAAFWFLVLPMVIEGAAAAVLLLVFRAEA